ncbi:MAG: response regulator [Steroidobacteraceae bacterium]|jgi:two-component system chemotaxis response regulator CheY
MKAIIIDDSRSMRAILAGWLKEQGFEIIEVADGKAAMEVFRRSGPLDIAVIDWNMPVMNGYELIVELRCIPTFDSMPILMVSTEGSEAQQAEALAAGANEYLAKPVMEEAFIQKLQKLGFDAR